MDKMYTKAQVETILRKALYEASANVAGLLTDVNTARPARYPDGEEKNVYAAGYHRGEFFASTVVLDTTEEIIAKVLTE